MSGIGKQAKVLTEHQQQALLAWLETRKHADRNRLIVLLSFKSGLRSKGNRRTEMVNGYERRRRDWRSSSPDQRSEQR